jgi:hypothetical protein
MVRFITTPVAARQKTFLKTGEDYNSEVTFLMTSELKIVFFRNTDFAKCLRNRMTENGHVKMPLRHRHKKKAPVQGRGLSVFILSESMRERIGSQLEVGCEWA